MSLLTFRNTKTIEMPLADGYTVTIRQLAGRHLDKARKASQLESVQSVRELGAALIKEIQQITREEIAEEKQSDPLLGYDHGTLVRLGVTAWSLDDELSPETCEELPEDTQEALAREILRYSKPSLFRTADDAEAAQKNG